MQRLEVSGAVRPIYGSLGVKRLIFQLRTTTKFKTPRAVNTGTESYIDDDVHNNKNNSTTNNINNFLIIIKPSI